MKKLALPLAAALLLTISGAVRAQGGPPGGGMGGAAPSPEMMAMFKKFGEWREKNKSLSSVGRTLGALAEFEKDPKTALTKDQAKKILAVVGPWKSKPIMTDANAKDMLKKVGATFTPQQAKKLAQIMSERGGFGGGGGGGMRMGGGGAPGGGAGGGGARPGGGAPGGGAGGGMDMVAMKKRFDTMMKGYNPLNFKTVPESPMKERSIKPVKDAMAALDKKAK
ncbi:hypothetical protein [Armatimonas sp.]|uniref:hypothetical protein n=1 Tax=Armatimonas sp. TaxID=1872638 RepID=UPI00374D2918